jgi:bifunctional DNase/RNase
MGAITRPVGLSVLLVASLALAGARAQSAPPSPPAGAQEVSVMGVFVDSRTQRPMVVLQGKRDKRSLAMAIGAAEATGIALPLENVTPPRPLTHDLFLTLFGRLNVKVSRVVITDLRDDTYFATLFLTAGGAAIELDSRPSDAIALAIRAKAPVYANDRVFDKGAPPPGGPASPGPRI